MDKKVTSIGGQALMEGVMMRGPTSMAMAVRNKDGFIEVDSVRLKPIRWYNKVPVLRGVVSFVESLYNGVNTITKSAQVVGDEDEKISNGGMIFAVCAGVLLAIGLFMLVPELIASLIDGLIGHSVLLKSLIAGALRMIIFVAYLLIVSKMKDIRRTFMYHGAEHRTINCYESGMELTVENVQKCSTRHNRCGTTFFVYRYGGFHTAVCHSQLDSGSFDRRHAERFCKKTGLLWHKTGYFAVYRRNQL